MEYFGVDKVLPLLYKTWDYTISEGTGELQKLQYGSIDCLGIMLKVSLTQPKELLTEKGSKVSTIDDILPMILQCISGQQTCTLRMKLCFLNCIISCIKMVPVSMLQLLAQKTFEHLAACSLMSKQKEGSLRAASLQVLFTMTFQLGSEVLPYASPLLQISMDAMKDTYPQCRLNALKVLGTLMASVDELFRDDINLFFKMQSLLEGISNMDTSTETRQLAEKYLTLMNQNR